MRTFKTLILSFIVINSFCLALSYSPSVMASTKPTGITISPAFQQIKVPGDSVQQPLTFTITNDKSAIQNLKLSSADFNTLSETGGLFFVGANPTDIQKKYGLIKWLQLPYTELSLHPGQTVAVHANILNKASMAPGGHYGAINITVENATGGLTNNINVRPVASTLLFVTKIGGDTHKLDLANVSVKHSIFSLPNSVILDFRNVGNTHLIPRGIVKIVNPSGKLISQGTINQNSDIILPESKREYTVDLRQLSSATSFGKYKLYVDFRIDGIDQPRGYQSSFWIVPMSWVVAGAIVLVLLFTAIVFGFRRYKTKQKH